MTLTAVPFSARTTHTNTQKSSLNWTPLVTERNGQPSGEFLTVKQAAAYLSISVRAVYDIVKMKKIAHYRLGAGGGAIRFRQADLDEYSESCRQPVESAIPQPPRRRRQVRSLAGLKYVGDCLPSSRRA